MDFVGASLPLSLEGLERCATTLGVGHAEIWTILSVETNACGFLPDRRPMILFERHLFHQQTNGVFDLSHPSVSSPDFGGYVGNAGEYDRLIEAIALNREAALKSTSWGIGQILGINSKLAGFASVDEMVRSAQNSEDAQLAAVAQFLRSRKLDLLLVAHDWKAYAREYNGPDFARNQYDTRLAAAYAKFSVAQPNILVRQAQVLLMFLGFAPGVIDGVSAKRTRAAVNQFRTQHGLPSSDEIDDSLVTVLMQYCHGKARSNTTAER